jgi:phosphate uptake regulator
MIDDALRAFKSEEYLALASRFQNSDDVLDKLALKLYVGVNLEVYQFNKRKVTKNG